MTAHPQAAGDHVETLAVHDLCIDTAARRVWKNGDEVHLTGKEFDLLRQLVRHAGQVVDRRDLIRNVWQTDSYTTSKTLDVHVGFIRRKLGDPAVNPRLITTVRGRGLRFEV